MPNELIFFGLNSVNVNSLNIQHCVTFLKFHSEFFFPCVISGFPSQYLHTFRPPFWATRRVQVRRRPSLRRLNRTKCSHHGSTAMSIKTSLCYSTSPQDRQYHQQSFNPGPLAVGDCDDILSSQILFATYLYCDASTVIFRRYFQLLNKVTSFFLLFMLWCIFHAHQNWTILRVIIILFSCWLQFHVLCC